MKITFDLIKRVKTLAQRSLDFARAGEIFEGHYFTLDGDRREGGEPRNITVGKLDGGMVVMVWTPCEEETRIISMRAANEREHAKYGKLLD
jgi:uncharacterized DUF497 family protein